MLIDHHVDWCISAGLHRIIYFNKMVMKDSIIWIPTYYIGAVYMEAALARLARQPGKRDEFVLCML